MIKVIKYAGYTASPDDYISPDGELASVLNLVPEDGVLKPVAQPVKWIDMQTNTNKVWYIHKTSSIYHFIYSEWDTDNQEEQFYWMDEINAESGNIDGIAYAGTDSSPVSQVVAVNAIGNTLLIVCKDEVRYYLWKEVDGKFKYQYLGNHLPEIYLSFGLQGHPRVFSKSDEDTSQIKLSFDSMEFDDAYPDEQRSYITSKVMAKVNKFVAEQGEQSGRFIQPFLVRYALRLYDGSLVMHSAPVLMNPGTNSNPIVWWTENNASDGKVSSVTADIFLMACDLDFQLNTDMSDSFSDWTDIVKSVDIFVSKPIYTYDQSGNIDATTSKAFDSIFIGKLYNNGSSGTSLTPEEDKYMGTVNGNECMSEYAEWKFADIYNMYFHWNREMTDVWPGFRLPVVQSDSTTEDIKDTSLFYFLKSYKIENLPTSRTKVEISTGYLQSLVAREVMTDDYQSHDTIIPQYVFGYNSRLNCANIKRKLFKGFPLSSMLAYCSNRVVYERDESTVKVGDIREVTLSIAKDSSGKNLQDKYSVEVYYKGDTSGVLRVDGSKDLTLQDFLCDLTTALSTGTGSWGRVDSWGSYFFYPDSNAYKMRIISLGTATQKHAKTVFEIKLEAHTQLNGAVAVLDYEQYRTSDGTTTNTADATFAVDVPNKVYTSQVNNPFYFPLSGINTVGTGRILGLSTAAKALSQGQFGQFPLYCFTDEGVWALEVSATGTYSAKQPITRDVCISSESITQLDSAVLFATARGIMMLSGSNTVCITDPLVAESYYFPDDRFDKNLPKILLAKDRDGKLKLGDFQVRSFLSFISDCRMIYSYKMQRITVYNTSKTYSYAYVYSLKDKKWGAMRSYVRSHVPSYPEAYALLEDDGNMTLCDFSRETDEEVYGAFVTRPLKLDSPDTLKTVDTVIQRGHFYRGQVGSAIYASRDLRNWHLVWTSVDHYLRGFRGTPYKYFCLIVPFFLSPGDCITGATVQYTPRLTNQPR